VRQPGPRAEEAAAPAYRAPGSRPLHPTSPCPPRVADSSLPVTEVTRGARAAKAQGGPVSPSPLPLPSDENSDPRSNLQSSSQVCRPSTLCRLNQEVTSHAKRPFGASLIEPPPGNGSGGGSYWKSAREAWEKASPYVIHAAKEWPTWVMRRLKVAAHYGFLPFVIAVGCPTSPAPHPAAYRALDGELGGGGRWCRGKGGCKGWGREEGRGVGKLKGGRKRGKGEGGGLAQFWGGRGAGSVGSMRSTSAVCPADSRHYCTVLVLLYC